MHSFSLFFKDFFTTIDVFSYKRTNLLTNLILLFLPNNMCFIYFWSTYNKMIKNTLNLKVLSFLIKYSINIWYEFQNNDLVNARVITNSLPKTVVDFYYASKIFYPKSCTQEKSADTKGEWETGFDWMRSKSLY